MCFSLPQSKALQVDTSLTLSMTRVLSLREFAKRERANSWQSKGKFAFKFVDCHANFCKICSQWRRILSFWAERVSTKRPSDLQGVATAKKSTYKDGTALSFWAFAKGEKSTEFKIHFDFVDTSLSCESSVWQCKECSVWQDKSVWQGFCHFEWVKRTKNP